MAIGGMTALGTPLTGPTTTPVDESIAPSGELSLLAIGAVLFRRKWLVAGIALVGGLVGATIGLLTPIRFVSSATFLPQAAGAPAAGLAAAASQLGLNVPSASGTWGPGIFVQVLESRSILEPIATERFKVPEQSGHESPLPDLLGFGKLREPMRTEMTLRALQGRVVSATEDRRLGTVTLHVMAPWPSLAQTLAQRLLTAVNDFNFQTRKSQASAERQFIEGQLAEAQSSLLASENRMQAFLSANRNFGNSPQLTFERDRLQRDVSLRQQVYTSLVQSREDARIREVRDTPVITVIEAPALPLERQPRGTATKAIGGLLLGAIVATILVFAVEALERADENGSESARSVLSGLAKVGLRRRSAAAQQA